MKQTAPPNFRFCWRAQARNPNGVGRRCPRIARAAAPTRYVEMRTILWTWFAIFLAGASQVRALPADGHAMLDKKISILYPSDVEAGLTALCRSADIPCGVEELWLVERMSRTPGTMTKDAKPASVESHVEAILARHPDYQWSAQRGVINVAPRSYSGDGWKYASLMDRRIDTIDLDGVSLNDAAGTICKLAGGSCYDMSGGGQKRGALSLHLKGATFREALNELVRKNRHALWVYHPKRESSALVTLRIRCKEFISSIVAKVLRILGMHSILGYTPWPTVSPADFYDYVYIWTWVNESST
jgi:hypothetical protein